MFEPEIARRCLSCGASVRQRASFCAQCGQLIDKQPPDAEADFQTEPPERPSETIIDAAEFPTEVLPDTPEPQPDSAVTQAIIMPEDVRHSVPLVAETQQLVTQPIQREPTASETDVPLQPSGDGSRLETEHHLMDRVARIREVSSVVIDQAAYDPSLRFLLVAAVLFILFVILMILSKVIG